MQPNSAHSGSRAVPAADRTQWVTFAGIILMLGGLFGVINGLVALLDHGYYATTPDHGTRLLVFGFALWGWIWVLFGCVQMLTSLGVFLGVRGAPITGVVLASASMIGQLAFLSAFPLWSLVSMAMSVLVIYGLLSVPRPVVATQD
ncbi:DUF7144 family membrane protein [Peterkaempfera griseoplana]|uniref:DUF7144 family membrane protein n=1 Tax=Peterkaempfera griseoplana TaxID=66896 RepID=UPI0006E129F6|nr:hypothetical protein [Peterkaempfera griseoplana]